MEIGVLIAKNGRLQSIIRQMQREAFVVKSDASTQTTDNFVQVCCFSVNYL